MVGLGGVGLVLFSVGLVGAVLMVAGLGVMGVTILALVVVGLCGVDRVVCVDEIGV
jgi:hypothetical protein